jgi:hypothetical protein
LKNIKPIQGYKAMALLGVQKFLMPIWFGRPDLPV